MSKVHTASAGLLVGITAGALLEGLTNYNGLWIIALAVVIGALWPWFNFGPIGSTR